MFGSFVELSRQSVEGFMTEWLSTIEPTVRPSTLHSYKRNLTVHVVPNIGQLKLQQLDAGTLNGLYAHLLAGTDTSASGLSPRSVRYVHTILHRALKDAVRWQRLARNPADAADPPRVNPSQPKTVNTSGSTVASRSRSA